jgi:hypothetical protein
VNMDVDRLHRCEIDRQRSSARPSLMTGVPSDPAATNP